MFSLSRSISYDSPFFDRKTPDEEKKSLRKSSSKDSLKLDVGLSISKDHIHIKHVETFTQKTFEELITQAKGKHLDYFFVSVEDMSQKTYFFDGIQFVNWLNSIGLSEEKDIPTCNPLNRESILDIDFYMIAQDDDIAEFHEYAIPHVCNWKEFMDKKNYLYYDHLVALSDPELKKERREILEYNLALDFLLGRGIESDIEKAVNYIETKASNGNFLCAFLLSLCFTFGLGKMIDHSRSIFWNKKFNDRNSIYDSQSLLNDIYKEVKEYLNPSDILYKIFHSKNDSQEIS